MSDHEQLLHLVDRARRGVALPAELDQLAAGITVMADDRDRSQRSATYRLDVLRKRRQQIRKAEDHAEQAERDHGRAEILRATAEHNAQDQADRRRTAEATIARVRAELHALASEVRGIGPIALAGRRDAVARLRAALDEQQPTT